jgi:hypothetical protein
MKRIKLLTEQDRENILGLYKQKNLISEQQATAQVTTNYTIQDLQNMLNRPPYNSKLVADNKFGPMTAGAITKALDMIKSGQAADTGAQSIQSKKETTLQTPTAASDGLAQSSPTLQTGPSSPSTTTQTTSQQPAQQTTQQPAQQTTQQPAQQTTQQQVQSSAKGDDSTVIE